MKELSIEEKARAYDKALERAQALYNDKNEIGYANVESVLEEVFPSLKESENEKIRKTIIRFFKDQYSNETEMYDGSVTVGKAIAWLEKQDNNKLNTNIKSCIEMILTDADEQRFKDYNTNLAVCLAWLKRQGKEKPIDWSDYDRTMAFTLMRDVDQMTCISKKAKNERIGWLNSLDEKFINYD